MTPNYVSPCPGASLGLSAIHVLTVHYNTPTLTCRLVQALPERTLSGREVFVHILDNASEPPNLATLRADISQRQNVTLTSNTVNVGFGEGVNTLFRVNAFHDSSVIWILNPDTLLDDGCLDALEQALTREKLFSVVSPLIYSGEGGSAWIWYCGGSLSEEKVRVEHNFYGQSLKQAPAKPFETEFITGAAPMMLAATFRAVGGFPYGYFLYWEDVYFSWRARGLGFKLGVVPSATLWHAVGASSGVGQSATFYYWFARNRFRFARDIGVNPRSLLVGSRGVDTLRRAVQAVRERDGKSVKLRAFFRGLRDGLADAEDGGGISQTTRSKMSGNP